MTKMTKMKLFRVLLCAVFLLTATTAQSQVQRIVSINGTVTEIICALGFEKSIVGVDLTSTFPASMKDVTKVGHNRNLNTEGILALSPTIVTGLEADIKPEVKQQLVAAGINVILFKQDYSIAGTKALVTEVATSFGKKSAAIAVNKKIDNDVAAIKKSVKNKKVLFIYARGAGNMMVAGEGTPVEKAIQLAGGINAIVGFNDYKPLTAEAVVAANPDVILMFTSGLESMGGIAGLLKIQGIAQTNAGKNKKVIEMDGQLLTGFGPRVGIAIATLASQL